MLLFCPRCPYPSILGLPGSPFSLLLLLTIVAVVVVVPHAVFVGAVAGDVDAAVVGCAQGGILLRLLLLCWVFLDGLVDSVLVLLLW